MKMTHVVKKKIGFSTKLTLHTPLPTPPPNTNSISAISQVFCSLLIIPYSFVAGNQKHRRQLKQVMEDDPVQIKARQE